MPACWSSSKTLPMISPWEHRLVERRVGQQLEHVGPGPPDAEGLARLDRAPEPVGQRLDGLEAALGRAGEEAADRVGAQLLDQPERLLASLRRQGPGHVGALPFRLASRVGVPHEIEHGRILPMTQPASSRQGP
jgi:hypothetical protein